MACTRSARLDGVLHTALRDADPREPPDDIVPAIAAGDAVAAAQAEEHSPVCLEKLFGDLRA